MTTQNNDSGARNLDTPSLHLVCGSGGSRAILAGTGTILALSVAGQKKFHSMGGISGGSIPTALLALGMDAKELTHLALDLDFAEKLTRHSGIFKIIFAYFMQRRYEKTRPVKGVMSSEKLGYFLEDLAKKAGDNVTESGWPKGYWTMAVAGRSRYVFTDHGIYEHKEDGNIIQLSDKPGPLAVAVRGSCAVPGVIDAVPYEDVLLHDGAMGPEGRCPVGLVQTFFGASRDKIVAMDVGDDSSKWSRRIYKLWKTICGDECIPPDQDDLTNEGGLMLATPTAMNFRSLQFTLTRDQKWEAVMAGFMGSLPALTASGVLAGENLARANEIAERFKEIQFVCTDAQEGTLAAMTDELMSKHGLY